MPNSGRFAVEGQRAGATELSVQAFTRRAAQAGPILVVGDVMLDRFFWSDCQRISPEAPVPVARVRDETVYLGGAANVAASIVALGGNVELFGVTSDEGSAAELVKLLSRARVPAEGLVFESGRRLSRKNRVVAGHQQILRYDEEDDHAARADSQDRLLSAFERALPNASCVILSDYGKGTLPAELLPRLIDAARRRGLRVLVDPNGADWQKYRGANIVTPNRKQVALATGTDPVDASSAELAGRLAINRFGIEYCLITLSEDGAALVGRDTYEHVPAAARSVREVTGAGDTFVGVLGLALAGDLSLSNGCRVANAAAGVVVEKIGTATLTRHELERALLDPNRESAAANGIVDLQSLLAIREDLRQLNKKLVFTNGCFDVLHAGHVRCLRQAAAFGDVLVVGLNSDESVRRLKGPSRPIHRLAERGYVLAAFGFVDYVVAFTEDTPLRLIEQLRPDVLVKGADYALDEVVGASLVKSSGGDVHVVPLLPKHSTTRVVEMLNQEGSCSS